MLDALFGGNSGNKKQQQEELQALVHQAREERAALSAMLTQMAGGTSKLAQTSKALDQVGQKADLALEKLDELTLKVTGYDERAKGLEQIEKRIGEVLDQVAEAHRVTEKISAPDGELQKHRLAVNQLASQALENQATIETLRKERASFEDLRGQLKVSTAEVVRSVEGVSALKGEFDAVRSVGAQLTQEFTRIRETSREAKEVVEGASAPASIAGIASGVGGAALGARGYLGAARAANYLEAATSLPNVGVGGYRAVTGDTEGARFGGALEAGLGALGVRSGLSTNGFRPVRYGKDEAFQRALNANEGGGSLNVCRARAVASSPQWR